MGVSAPLRVAELDRALPPLGGIELKLPLLPSNDMFGLPGVPAFLCSNELKKLARIPSPPGCPGVSLASICKSKLGEEIKKTESSALKISVQNVPP